MTEPSERFLKAIEGLPPAQRASALEAFTVHRAAQARDKALAGPPKPTGRPKSTVGGTILIALTIAFTIGLGNWVLEGCHNDLTEPCHHRAACSQP